MSIARRLPLAFLLLSLSAFAASAPGIKNFDQVDSHVYRGGQPTDQGFGYLAKLGVKTIVDLREAGSRSKAEEAFVTAAGMKYVNVPMSGLTPPTDAEITRLLRILEDPAAGAVFVHCWRGADRTGAVIAAYHIDHDHWDNARALSDARTHKMSSFQLPRQSYIRSFRARTADPKTTIAGDASVTAATGAAN
jgi:protein tyrosine/serine phosphatase